jgi:manganese/zinc/iron transport system substrate-binding protein
MIRSLLLASLLVLAACAPADSRAPIGERPVQVVATTNIVADLARVVGGDRAEVEALMGPGVDPHLYRATEGDVGRMTGADLILYNGFHLEGKMVDLLGRVENAAAVAEGIDAAELLTPPDYEGNADPHVWMDVRLWQEAVEAAADAFARVDPEHADTYRQNADAYRADLDALDAYVRERIAEVPEGQRVLVTAHDAFNYFGEAYGFEVRGLQGISTATEAGTADVQDLAQFVAERQIPALFVESSVSPRTIQAVREAVQARGFEVEIGGTLYADALGGAGSGAETYTTMIRANVDTIVDALTPAE